MNRRSARDALVMAIVGRPAGLPGPERIDLAGFWARFDATAPWLVRTGFDLATVAVAVVAPRLAGHCHGLAGLDAATADSIVRRAARHPLGRPLVEAATVVACFAYFSDDRVEAVARGTLQVGPPPADDERS